MLKHVVMFRFSETNTRITKQQFKDKLDALKNKIPEIKYLETGINTSSSTSSYDIVLISEFNSETELNTYRIHPDHQEVVKIIQENNIQTKVVDYLI